MTPLAGKWALVTGSSRGIGQQIALGLARLGCNVVLHGRKAESVGKTLSMLQVYAVETHVVAGDLGVEAGVRAVIRGVEVGPGYVDILYNNAAIMSAWLPVWKIPRAEWLKTFQVNLFAVVELCNAFAPGMVERGYGRIINLTSGIKDTPQLAPYSVSKAAIDKYTQIWPLSYGGRTYWPTAWTLVG
jgi:NAD(P)-dependent dehydrogenase (short-subunit alcohol dehydrogenase family)